MNLINWPGIAGQGEELSPAISFEWFEPPEWNERYRHFFSLLSPEEQERRWIEAASKPKEEE